jgi:hypothetical protein
MVIEDMVMAMITAMDIMAILMGTVPITTVMEIPIMTGTAITVDQRVAPVIGDEIMGEGSRIIFRSHHLTRTETDDKLFIMDQEKEHFLVS